MSGEAEELYYELEDLQNQIDAIGIPKTPKQVQKLADLQAAVNAVQARIECAE